MKLFFYKNTKMFVCYTECGSMSIFKFLRQYYETRAINYDWYNDIYLAVLNCSSYRPNQQVKPKYTRLGDQLVKRETPQLPVFDSRVLDTFIDYYTPEWLNDNITKAAMKKYNIKYSISQNKIIIPHYNINGELVGIRGRALNPDEIENFGKYMPVKVGTMWYSHPLSVNLYGLNFNKKNIIESGIALVFEAEKSVLQMEGYTDKNCAVAVCGSNFNKFQLDLLMRQTHPQEIVICFDKEEKEGSGEYFNKLLSICKKYQHYCNFSFIYDRNGLLDMKDSPTDKGKDIFLTLFKERIKVK